MNVTEIQKYINHGFNILLVGEHGVGKTQMVQQACEDLGLKFKYFSAATMDPYTDFVGIPFVQTDEDGSRHLESVRPVEIDEAEVLMLDEANRSEDKIQNALMEIIQFRTINGDPLPNLKCVIAAVNPPGGKYKVSDLDPALQDRFHITIEVEANYSVDYFTERFNKDVAAALVTWVTDHSGQADYVSPRRLEYLGEVWMKTSSRTALSHALPPGNFDLEKLYTLLSGIQEVSVRPAMTKIDFLEMGSTEAIEEALLKDRANGSEDFANQYAQACNKEHGPVTTDLAFYEIMRHFTDDQFDIMTNNWGDDKVSEWLKQFEPKIGTKDDMDRGVPGSGVGFYTRLVASIKRTSGRK